jgi:cytochrome c oxidase subunit 2
MGWILGLAALVLVLDLSIDARGAQAWEKIKEGGPEASLTVKVQAQQFLWTFVYPGKDGKMDTADDLVSTQELHVPVNTRVKLLLRSHDVIHALFMPAARFQQDILPGREIPAWIELNTPGESPIACAQLCGSAHSAMSGKLVVEDEKSFKKFLAGLAADNH